MKPSEPLSRITLFDRINATTLSLVTPEMKTLNAVRERNGYSETPSYAEPPDMPLEFKEIGGVKIRMAHAPNPGRPSLVMFSPFPQSILAYAPIWADLAAEYDLYAVDLPGFGRSEGGLEFMSFKAQGDFVDALLRHLDIGEVHLLGPDVGMPAVLYYVGTYENSVRSILVGDGPAIDPSSNASVIRKMVDSAFWRMIFRVAGAGALVEAGRKICYVNYSPNEIELSDYKLAYSERVSAALQWFKDYPSSLATVDPLLDKIKLPTLVFWGDQDAILYKDNGERIQQRIAGSELHVFEDCGHFCYQDRADEFKAMVKAWMGRHA